MDLSLLDQWKFTRLIMADPDLLPSSKVAAFFLLDHHNLKTGRCDPSMETLAERSRHGSHQRSVDTSPAASRRRSCTTTCQTCPRR